MLFIISSLKYRKEIPYASLIIPVKYHAVVKTVLHRIVKSHLVRSAKAVIFPVAKELYRDFGMLLYKGRNNHFGIVCAPVVDNYYLRNVLKDLIIKLLKYSDDLFLAVICGNKGKYLIPSQTSQNHRDCCDPPV